MDFLHFDIGHASAGDVVIVSLDHQARVQLLDHQNLELYRHGRDFRAVRVWAKESPAQLRVPHAGHWHVAVDLGGRAGRIGAEVDLVRAA